MENNFIQFELWKDCKQGCKFCCNKGQPTIDKDVSCKYILEKLDEVEPNKYDSIGFIGGELFNGELEGYMEQFKEMLRKSKNLNTKKIFIASALICDIDKYLIPIFDYLKELGIISKIEICTSWDIKYRFHTEKQKELWENNLKRIHELYPEVMIHLETVLTQHLIDDVLKTNDPQYFEKLKEKYGCYEIDFMEPTSGLYYHDKFECEKDVPGFFPTKTSFIEFLKLMKNNIDLDRMFSVNLRSDTLYYIENGQHKVFTNRRARGAKPELEDKTKKYDTGCIDTYTSMRDIVLMIKEMQE